MLVTDQGFAYPLTATNASSDGAEDQVLPLMEKKMVLNGYVPNKTDLSKVSVYILYPQGDDKGGALVPITIFKSFSTSSGPVTTGEILGFGESKDLIASNGGKLKVTFSKVQRLPWD